uniref:Uncharacterized protein n=1 Tax=Timema tahoe TaxID=61484 RepID=A0A7R9II50_9NEOP|nr:unnamed protein product [Timema tahoe]
MSATAPIVLPRCLPLLSLSSQDVCHCSHCSPNMSVTALIVLPRCLPLLPLSSQYVCHCSHCPPKMSATAPIVLPICLPLLPLSSQDVCHCSHCSPNMSATALIVLHPNHAHWKLFNKCLFQTYSKQRSHLTSPRCGFLLLAICDAVSKNSENNPPPNHQAQQCILHKTKRACITRCMDVVEAMGVWKDREVLRKLLCLTVRPLRFSSALAQTAPTTLSTAWAAPHFMFSEPSMTSSPLYLTPIRTPLVYWLTWRPLYLMFLHANDISHLTRLGSSGGYLTRGSSLANHVAGTIALPPTATHVAGTIALPPTATHVAGTIALPPTATHVAETITLPPHRNSRCRDNYPTSPPQLTLPGQSPSLPTATHVAGTITLPPHRNSLCQDNHPTSPPQLSLPGPSPFLPTATHFVGTGTLPPPP